MGAVVALISFGIGIIGGGLYWKLQEDILAAFFDKYAVAGPYYTATNMIWNAIPFILIIVGVLCLISAGLLGRTARTVVYE